MSEGRDGSEPEMVHIHYHRPPDRKDVFHQQLLLDHADVKVTFARDMSFDPPLTIRGEVVLETGSDVVWFTFPGRWHDIGRFHAADGTFRGCYANILTPPTFHERGVWRTTDLFLDVWLPAGGNEPVVLDRDQLEEAVERGWIAPGTARRARREADRILETHAAGRWPPAVVDDWTLERARVSAGEAYPSSASSASASSSGSTR